MGQATFSNNTTVKMNSGGSGTGTTVVTTAANGYALITFQCGQANGNNSTLTVGSATYTLSFSTTVAQNAAPVTVYAGPSTVVSFVNGAGTGSWSYVTFVNTP